MAGVRRRGERGENERAKRGRITWENPSASTACHAGYSEEFPLLPPSPPPAPLLINVALRKWRLGRYPRLKFGWEHKFPFHLSRNWQNELAFVQIQQFHQLSMTGKVYKQFEWVSEWVTVTKKLPSPFQDDKILDFKNISASTGAKRNICQHITL